MISLFIFLKTFFKNILCIYLSERQAQRERGNTSRGRSRLPVEQADRCGAPSQGAGTMTRAEGRRLALNDEPPRRPIKRHF